MEIIITIAGGLFVIATAIISYYQINKDFDNAVRKEERGEKK